jgi:hypothetical protein
MEADIEALDRGEAVSDMEPLVIGDGPRHREPLTDLAFDLTQLILRLVEAHVERCNPPRPQSWGRMLRRRPKECPQECGHRRLKGCATSRSYTAMRW